MRKMLFFRHSLNLLTITKFVAADLLKCIKKVYPAGYAVLYRKIVITTLCNFLPVYS
jgi:hypothetical protein